MLRDLITAKGRTAVVLVAIFTSISLVAAQTKIVAPDNKYKPAEDVKLGRDAAREVEQELPLLNNDGVQSYVERVGSRLAEHVPGEFRHAEFAYTFKVVNVSEINAFALPGGPMYVNRGMIEAAKNEGEMAGVMAHEISHVALRHGTAQAGKATPYAVGSLLGQIAGAVIGGTLGQIVGGATQFGLGTAFLRYGRDYERQADLLGAQIMARAGYDPRDMANMFQTIQAKSGNGGPEWLSSHPNPSNRFQAINQEAAALPVSNPIRNTAEFTQVKSRLQRMAPAPTTEQATKQAGRRTDQGGSSSDNRIGQVEPPSTRYQTYDGGDIFRVSVPSNWQELPGTNTVTFSPKGGHGSLQGRNIFTHALQIGVDRSSSRDLRAATEALIDSLGQGNPQLRQTGSYKEATVDGRRGLTTLLSNVSDGTGEQERIGLYTALLNDGRLFYVVGVAPAREFSTYQPIFNRSVRSLQIN